MFGSDEMFQGEISGDHYEFRNRIRRSLYYSHMPVDTCTSLPFTEWAVEFLQDAAPRKLGGVDTYFASAVARESCISPCSMMLGMLYIERLKHKNPDYLQTVSSSELFLISMMMATKYLQDEGVEEEVYNDEWAESCNMDISDLNKLEKEFLSAMDWQLFVSRNDFDKQLDSVERRIALCEGFKRGWFTYSDLYVLMNDPKFSKMLQDVGQDVKEMMIAGSVAYLAGFVTLLGSTLLVSCISTSLPVSVLHSSHQLLVTHDSSHLPAIAGIPSVAKENADLPHPAETTEDNSNATEYGVEDDVEKKSSLSGIVRRFWALFMLKDTLVNLISTQQMGDQCKDKANITSRHSSKKCFYHRFQEKDASTRLNHSSERLHQSKKSAEPQTKNSQSSRPINNCSNNSQDCRSVPWLCSTCRMQNQRIPDGKYPYHLLADFQKRVDSKIDVGRSSWYDTGHSACSLEYAVHHFSPGISQQIQIMT